MKESIKLASALALALGLAVQPTVAATESPTTLGSTIGLVQPSDKSATLSERVKAALPKSQAAGEYDGWSIDWMVVAGGGRTSSDSLGQYGSTMGQTAVSSIISSGPGISQGFWQDFLVAMSCCNLVADVDHNGVGPDVADLIFLVNFMFQGGDPPPCTEEADVDGDGDVVIIADLVYLVNYMFNGGPPPASCLL